MKKSSFSAWIVLVTLISPLVLPQALSAASHTVEYSTGGANVFTPAKLTVNVGDSVLFLHGTGTLLHTITGTTAAEPFCGNAAILSACSVTFNTPGIFPYRCLNHSTSGATPTGMVGSITVLSPVSLETATNVEGPYVATPSAVINTTAHTVTVPAPVGRAFWRLRSDTALHITKVEIVSSTPRTQLPVRAPSCGGSCAAQHS